MYHIEIPCFIDYTTFKGIIKYFYFQCCTIYTYSLFILDINSSYLLTPQLLLPFLPSSPTGNLLEIIFKRSKGPRQREKEMRMILNSHSHCVTRLSYITSLHVSWTSSPISEARRELVWLTDPPPATEKVHFAISNNLLALRTYLPAFIPDRASTAHRETYHLHQERAADLTFLRTLWEWGKAPRPKKKGGFVLMTIKSVFKKQPGLLQRPPLFSE